MVPESSFALRQGLVNLRSRAHALRREVSSLRRDLRGEAPPSPIVAKTSPEPAPKAEPTLAPAPEPAAKALSLAERIAALGKDFDPNARDESFIDTGTPDAAFEAAEHADEEVLDPSEAVINTAADGSAYWGSIDNDSARAKARGDTLIIDQHECIHCGTCVENTAAVFVLPDDSKAVAYRQEGPMDLIQDAIDACPVTCIHWTKEPEQFPQINDAKGRPLDG